MRFPDMPVAVGVFREVSRPCYDEMFVEQIATARAKSGPGDLRKLIYNGDMWEVGEQP
jgi:2-oxoglutarate ferredoxin oxidoreductase subunit beta